MTRLSLDSFLSELTKLFQTANAKKAGSVQLAWKAYSPNADAAARASSSSSSSSKKKKSSKPAEPEVKAEDEPVCLLHARLGDKKISTLIPTKDVPKFHRSFSALLIVNCSEGLLAKGETKGKRKQPASSPTSPTASKKKSTKKQKKDPNAMTDVAPASAPAGSDSSSTAPKPVTLTRKQRAAIRAANPKPHVTKQQRRAIRNQPNPRKDLEKKKAGGASSSAAAPSGSAKKSNKK